jgi:hypothetical protein
VDTESTRRRSRIASEPLGGTAATDHAATLREVRSRRSASGRLVELSHVSGHNLRCYARSAGVRDAKFVLVAVGDHEHVTVDADPAPCETDRVGAKMPVWPRMQGCRSACRRVTCWCSTPNAVTGLRLLLWWISGCGAIGRRECVWAIRGAGVEPFDCSVASAPERRQRNRDDGRNRLVLQAEARILVSVYVSMSRLRVAPGRAQEVLCAFSRSRPSGR